MKILFKGIKKILSVFVLFLITTSSFAQKKKIILNSADKTWGFVTIISDTSEVHKIYDSLKTPLLIYQGKVYKIGGGCASSLIGGDINDRDDDGDVNNRDEDGNVNDRNEDGTSNKRNKGGNVAKRKRRGNASERDNNGNANNRNENGTANSRNAGDALSKGNLCKIDKKGRILLYSRTQLVDSKCLLYYKGFFFNNKYFKTKKHAKI